MLNIIRRNVPPTIVLEKNSVLLQRRRLKALSAWLC